MFESDSETLLHGSFDSDSESESQSLLPSIPSPRPRLLMAIGPIPSPRLRRVLDRETRCFESETRDSGNSDPKHRLIVL